MGRTQWNRILTDRLYFRGLLRRSARRLIWLGIDLGSVYSLQSLGLLCGVPFLFLTGWTTSVPWLIFAMAGFGYFKGLYDANSSGPASMTLSRYLIAEPRLASDQLARCAAPVGFVPIIIALAARHYGMSVCISATAGIYVYWLVTFTEC